MLNLLFNTLLTITPHNTQKRRRKERTTYGPLRRYSRWVTHPVRNPDRQGLTWAPELKLNFSGRNSFFGGIFCLECSSRRNKNRLRVVLHFSYNCRFSFRKLQIFISQTTDSHFANYRFSFRKLQILTSQTTDSHFANYRFSFRKLQIFISFRSISFRSISFRFVWFRFVSLHFVSQTTVSTCTKS